jgi:hypothetical protein
MAQTLIQGVRAEPPRVIPDEFRIGPHQDHIPYSRARKDGQGGGEA